MTYSTLLVPGYLGSEAAHWQTWLQSKLYRCQRLKNVDWHKPDITVWSNQIMQVLHAEKEPTVIVAHSFGCLASALAISQCPYKVAGVIMVAPPTPQHFNSCGVNTPQSGYRNTIIRKVPKSPLQKPGLLIASRNDPWMTFEDSIFWADTWQLSHYDAGALGHINTASGHGPWPLIKLLVDSLRWQLDTPSGHATKRAMATCGIEQQKYASQFKQAHLRC